MILIIDNEQKAIIVEFVFHFEEEFVEREFSFRVQKNSHFSQGEV
jgi:hypothetical protein